MTNRWFAIKGPDGEIVGPAMQNKDGAWDYSASTCNELRRLSERISGLRVVYVKTWRLKAARLGYRCVEVQLVEPGTAKALELARYAWDVLVSMGASITVPTEYGVGRDLAMLALNRALGRVTDEASADEIVESTAPTGGAESKEEGK